MDCVVAAALQDAKLNINQTILDNSFVEIHHELAE